MRHLRSSLASVAVLSLFGCGLDEDPPTASTASELAAVGPSGSYQVSPIPKRSTRWEYDETGQDLGTTWRIATTGSGSWTQGQGPLGFGESYVRTPVSFGSDVSNKYPTTYFRHPFVKNSGRVLKMYLRVMYDDGFVFYLNGHEGGRASMPSGPIGYGTLALGHEAENQYVTYDISSQIPNLTDAGTNTLAIEVHQQSRSSSDLVLDAELVMWMEGTLDYPSLQDIQRGELWTFWDQAAPPNPTTWKTTGTDLSTWKTAPGILGYGEPYIESETEPRMTTYFRKDLTVTGAVHGLRAEVTYDDGFVAYVNGTEIARVSMPAGAVGPTTAALGHEAGGVYQAFDWSAAAPLLHEGRNTIAVEVHQNATSSSDLVFDLSLALTGGWRRVPSGTTEALHGVAFADATHGFAVGDHGTLSVTTDGAHWTTRALPAAGTADLDAIAFFDATRGVIVGDAGRVLTTADGGVTWTGTTIAAAGDLTDVALAGDTAWVTDGSATLYRSDDAGATWTALPTGLTGSFRAVERADAQHAWIAGDVPVPGDVHSAIFGTADGGATWTQQWVSDLHGHYLFELEHASATRAWAVGELSLSGHGELKLGTTDGATWSVLPHTAADSGVYGIDFLDELHGWAVGLWGNIVHTDDGGASWSGQQAPSQADLPNLAGVAFTDASHGWAVGDGGAIFATTTGGT